jgi:hypothetical protein
LSALGIVAKCTELLTDGHLTNGARQKPESHRHKLFCKLVELLTVLKVTRFTAAETWKAL